MAGVRNAGGRPVVGTGMTTGLWIALAAVLVALAFGGYRARTDGRFRAHEAEPSTWARVAPATSTPPGERATLVQFSTAFCAPCRVTRRTLAEVAELVPGVAHVEIDAEQHLQLVRDLGIVRTPTTLVLDAGGHEISRAAGAPRREQVIAALGAAAS